MEDVAASVGEAGASGASQDAAEVEGRASRGPATLSELRAGRTLGRYELLLPIAQGGMAIVWAARMRGVRHFSKIVAVKTMLPALSNDPHFEQMFLREAELASRIKHPNVCEILDLGEEEGILYLVMEWIDGDALSTLLSLCARRGDRIPHAAAARIGIEVARGLHAAHELKDESGALLGLVHRDVSPQNLLVSAGGLVKIVDFGLAKALARSDQQETHAGHLKGKIQFMAPEQAFCDAIDRRVDVFALGIVLYQLVTLVHPFAADNELATLARITAPSPVERPDAVDPACPRALADVIMKALAKEKDARYATMSEFARALEAVLPELDAAPGAPSLEAFIADVLGARAAERAASLQAAIKEADQQDQPADSPRSLALPEAAPEPQTRAPRRRALVVLLAALVVIVAGVAAALLRSSPPAPARAMPAIAKAVSALPPGTGAAPGPAAETAPDPVASAAAPAASASARPSAPTPSGAVHPHPGTRPHPGAPSGRGPPSTLRKPDF